ncbi:MAG: hypothetical protein NVS3B20_07910 [Polyangiales bacterium]
MDNPPPDFSLRTLLGDKASLLSLPTPLEDAIVVHGDPKRFAAFTDLPELRSPTSLMDAWDGTLDRTVRAWSPPGPKPFEMHPSREQVRTLYESGFTILLGKAERFVPALRPLCRKLEQDLGVASGKVFVEAFCAMQGGRARPHFDAEFTINCQIHGTKTWWVAPNHAVRFPPVGMFLGRPPPADLENLLTQPIPKSLEGSDSFVGEPGSVVFLPPGVLHETRMDSPSLALLFTREPDTVADLVAMRLRKQLLTLQALRRPLLGIQDRSFREESLCVAAELRRIAAALESDSAPWWNAELHRFRLRPGLSAEGTSETSVAIRSANAVRTLTLEPSMVTILHWASEREAFTVDDISRDLATIDATVAKECVQRLVHAGLMENAS